VVRRCSAGTVAETGEGNHGSFRNANGASLVRMPPGTGTDARATSGDDTRGSARDIAQKSNERAAPTIACASARRALTHRSDTSSIMPRFDRLGGIRASESFSAELDE
jgi:hypothetical protein